MRPEGTEKGAKVWVFPGTDPSSLLLPAAPFSWAVGALFTFRLPLCLSVLGRLAARGTLSPADVHGFPFSP